MTQAPPPAGTESPGSRLDTSGVVVGPVPSKDSCHQGQDRFRSGQHLHLLPSRPSSRGPCFLRALAPLEVSGRGGGGGLRGAVVVSRRKCDSLSRRKSTLIKMGIREPRISRFRVGAGAFLPSLPESSCARGCKAELPNTLFIERLD